MNFGTLTRSGFHVRVGTGVDIVAIGAVPVVVGFLMPVPEILRLHLGPRIGQELRGLRRHAAFLPFQYVRRHTHCM